MIGLAVLIMILLLSANQDVMSRVVGMFVADPQTPAQPAEEDTAEDPDIGTRTILGFREVEGGWVDEFVDSRYTQAPDRTEAGFSRVDIVDGGPLASSYGVALPVGTNDTIFTDDDARAWLEFENCEYQARDTADDTQEFTRLLQICRTRLDREVRANDTTDDQEDEEEAAEDEEATTETEADGSRTATVEGVGN